ncbi:MAG: trimeric intracellular cation channel family protein [Lentisphaeria bacterium]|nr:trimeric intracellular cation channel family protein [Lentisphaeria bacterium]
MEENLIRFADLFGTVVFALTGAIKGVSRKLDLLGVVVLSCTVGVGGGIFRDCVTGALPAAALQDETYLILCILTAFAVFFFSGKFSARYADWIVYLDAVGLGVFTALGCAKATSFGLPPITIVLAGVITACGGGVVRDIFVHTVPTILKSDFYATASLFGGLLFLFLKAYFPLSVLSCFLAVSGFVTALRLLAYHYKIQLPKAPAVFPPPGSEK